MEYLSKNQILIKELSEAKLNNQDRIYELEQKYQQDIITGKETHELINLYRENKRIQKAINKLLK